MPGPASTTSLKHVLIHTDLAYTLDSPDSNPPISGCSPSNLNPLEATESYLVLQCQASLTVIRRGPELRVVQNIDFTSAVRGTVSVERGEQLFVFGQIDSFLIMTEMLRIPENLKNNETERYINDYDVDNNLEYRVVLTSSHNLNLRKVADQYLLFDFT